MPPERHREFWFWESVAARLAAIALAGAALIVVFQGCVIPSVKDEMKGEQQKTLEVKSAR
jgi:hypothetical protein